MVLEYDLDQPEGSNPIPKRRVRRFDDEELPYDIGSLEREALSYLGDWNFLRNKDGLGLVYRMGFKDAVDDEGDPLLVIVNFNAPFRERGVPFNDEAKRGYDECVQNASLQIANSLSLSVPNVIVVSVPIPEYMRGELEELLKHNSLRRPE